MPRVGPARRTAGLLTALQILVTDLVAREPACNQNQGSGVLVMDVVARQPVLQPKPGLRGFGQDVVARQPALQAKLGLRIVQCGAGWFSATRQDAARHVLSRASWPRHRARTARGGGAVEMSWSSAGSRITEVS